MVPSFVYLLFKFYFKSGRLCYLPFDTKYLSFQTISLVTRTLIRLFFLYFSSDKFYNSKGAYKHSRSNRYLPLSQGNNCRIL